MDLSTAIALASLVVAGLAYFAGVQRGKRQAREQRQHELEILRQQQAHESAAAATRRRVEEIDRVVASFVAIIRTNASSGIYAVADAGIATLNDDSDAREALRRMQLEVGHDPIKGQQTTLENVDLVRFFRFFREEGLSFAHVSPEQVLQRMRAKNIDPSLSAAR